MPSVYDEMQKAREALFAEELARMEQLAGRWATVIESLQRNVDLLADRARELAHSGKTLSPDLLRQQEHYQNLLRQARDEIVRYAPYVENEVLRARLDAALMGYDAAEAAITGLDPSIAAVFDTIDRQAIAELSGLLADGSPVGSVIKARFPEVWQYVEDSILKGVAEGLSPNEIAQYIAVALGRTFNDVARIVRTEMLRAYREATRETYKQSGVVQKYKRIATKDTRTCMACIVLDGRMYPITEPLIDHPHGRCAMVPIVDGAPEVTWESASSWFERLPDEDQMKMLGPSKYEAWKSGLFQLEDIAVQLSDPTWGGTIQVATLEELGVT